MISILNVLAALGQQTRLEVLTLLSRAPAGGLTSGDLAVMARVPANSMSTHLAILAAAGLVRSTRTGRKVVYVIEREAIEGALSNLSARLDDPKANHFNCTSSWKDAPPIARINAWSRKAVGYGHSDRWPCSVVIGGVANRTTGHGHGEAPDRRATQIVRR